MERAREAEQGEYGREFVQDEEGGDVGERSGEERGGVAAEKRGAPVVERLQAETQTVAR